MSSLSSHFGSLLRSQIGSLGQHFTKFRAKLPNTCHGRLPHCTNEKSTPPSPCPLSVFVPDFCLYFSLLSFHSALTHPLIHCKISQKTYHHKYVATNPCLQIVENVTLKADQWRPILHQMIDSVEMHKCPKVGSIWKSGHGPNFHSFQLI